MRKPVLNINRLKNKREEKGWSKNFASEEMGIAQSVYLRYENGQSAPSFSVIKNMALTLGTSVEYLTDVSDDDTPNEILISHKDPRLTYIVESYVSYSNEDKERLYKYAKGLGSIK